jgi:tetratricopeptide (TPR) repeat protein
MKALTMATATRRRLGWGLLALVALVGLGGLTRLVATARRDHPPKLPKTATGRERVLWAKAARDRGRLEEALAALEGVPDSDPDAARVWLARGMIEFDRDRARAEEAALLHALKLDPKLADARRMLVELYTIQSRRDELRAQYLALSATAPLGFDDLLRWGLGRRLDLSPADIAAKLQRMVRNDPDDRASRLALAENLRRLGRPHAADAALAPLPATDPAARALRAQVALDRGHVDAAAHLLAEGPADHPALVRLRGRLALAKGDGPEAVRQFRAALAAEPDDRDTLFGLGQALRLAGAADAAQPYLQAARARDHLEQLLQNARPPARREDPSVLQAIGDACRSLHRLAEARAWYRLALARDPINPQLQKTLFELDATLAPANPPTTSPR